MSLFRCPGCGDLRMTDEWPDECCAPYERTTMPPMTIDAGALSGRTIQEQINDGEIGIDPIPRAEQIQPASLDLRIGSGLYDVAADEVINEPGSGDDVVVEPGNFYLGHTIDEVSLPDYIIAFLQGRSSVGRKGIVVHKTAGIIDPGFEGQLTLEIYHFGTEPETFAPGDRVAQLVFIYTNRWTRGYDGTYQGQTGPTRPQ